MEIVNSSSVVGMTISQVNATLQQVQPTTTQATKRLPIHVKGECFLDTREEEMRCSLEILSLNHCEETSPELIESEKEMIEQQFYHGGKVTWMNLWLADKKIVGEVIQRDAYSEVNSLVKNFLGVWTGHQSAASTYTIIRAAVVVQWQDRYYGITEGI